ncbi:MAG: RNA 2',3'-cyclic phosphodiesterase [Candidatus Aenigmatarchaeota archaeon]
MRCFVSIDVDSRLKEAAINLQNQIPGDVKLVEPENLHFTLEFLGEISNASVIEERLAKIAGEFEPFIINIRGIGVFPDMNYIRVVWLGAEELSNLQSAVNPKEATPHLTIARVRSVKDKEALKAFIEKHKDIDIGQMLVDKIKLKKSTLTPSGPIYEDIRVFELRV